MSMLRTLIALLFAGFALPAMAQPAVWTSVETTHGTASLDVPCAKENVQVREREGLEAIRCEVSGVITFLFVLNNDMLAMFGFPGSSIADIRQNIEQDPDTEYSLSTSVSGYPAFYSEGQASDGKVAVGVVELSEDRSVMLNVQTDGSDIAEAAISDIFVRSWGSLQVSKP